MARLGQCIDDGNCGKRYQRERLARDYLENPSPYPLNHTRRMYLALCVYI